LATDAWGSSGHRPDVLANGASLKEIEQPTDAGTTVFAGFEANLRCA
jgi:hypothetical protein